MEKTGLSFGSFKDYFSRLPDMIEQYITTKGGDLGEKSVFVDLMNIIRGERTKRLRKERQEEERKKRKEKARPAMVSSLNTAGIEGDIAEAIGQTVNPDTVDADIKQPTVSVNEAGKQSSADDKYTCMKCHRTSKESDCNNLQCPHCGEACVKTASDNPPDDATTTTSPRTGRKKRLKKHTTERS